MLEQKDIEILKSLMQEVVKESEENILNKVDERISASENLVLNELDRVQTHLEKEVDEVRENLDEMKQFYRINKLESDNTTLLLQMYNNMQKEIEKIKTKIA